MKHIFFLTLIVSLLSACASGATPTIQPSETPSATAEVLQPTSTPIPTLKPELATSLGNTPYEVKDKDIAIISVRTFVGNTETDIPVEITSAQEVPAERFSGVNSVHVGKDKDGVQYFYSEGFGWSKDLTEFTFDPTKPLDLNKRVEVPFVWKDTSVLNTLMAWKISDWDAAHPETPTIPKDAVEPIYNLNINGWTNQTFMTIQMLDTLGGPPRIDGNQSTKFTTIDKLPFKTTGIFFMKDTNGNEVGIICHTRENSGSEKGKLINLFLGIDGSAYQKYLTTLILQRKVESEKTG